MDFLVSEYFHQASKSLSTRAGGNVPLDNSLWPEQWKTVFLKEYGRSQKIALTYEKLSADLAEIIAHRRSRRDFGDGRISKKEISLLLEYGCGIAPGSNGAGNAFHRAQPSAGGLFPIEMYVMVFKNTDEITQGIYHYNVKEHALDVLWNKSFEKNDFPTMSAYPWVAEASLLFVMTGVFSRNTDKYGERAYRCTLLEAGHIGQNLCLMAEAMKLKICPISGVRDSVIENMIDIDGVSESVIYVLAAGK